MPFRRNQPFEPEQLEAMDEAFRQACNALGVSDRDQPLAAILAKHIVELAQRGVRTKSALYFLAVIDFKSNQQ